MKPAKKFPGDMLGNVPKFNAVNRQYVEESNRRYGGWCTQHNKPLCPECGVCPRDPARHTAECSRRESPKASKPAEFRVPYRKHYRTFATLSDANAFCNEIMDKTGVVLTVIQRPKRKF